MTDGSAKNPENGLVFKLTPISRGKVKLTALLGGTAIHTDEGRIGAAEFRAQFIEAICRDHVGLADMRDAMAAELESLAAEPRDASREKEPGDPTGHPYLAEKTGLIWNKPSQDGTVPTPLTNFTATIVVDVAEDDGVQVHRVFEVEATIRDRTVRFSVPASHFQSLHWTTEHLGAGAVVNAGFGARDHTRAAIQLLSGEVPERRVFTHTGWRKVGDEHVYLHGGGAIGTIGTVSQIEVKLHGSLSHFALPAAPEGDELITAVRSSIKMLELAPDGVTIPLFAAIWRAVLSPADFAVHVSGPTGEGKTEIAALAQQHFGAGLDARHLPGSWSSTGNALEVLAFSAKDALLVIDDFAPGGSSNDVQRYHRDGDRVLRAQGNRSGRQRLRPDGTPRYAKPPRGLILSTGEDVPRGQSLRARMLVLEVGPGDLDWPILTQCQKDAVAGMYAQALAAYVRWLAARYDEIRGQHAEHVVELRQEAAKSTNHKRTPVIVAELGVGLKHFITFAQGAGALSAGDADRLWSRGWKALGEAAAAQSSFQVASDPVRLFLELLASAIASGNGHVAAPGGSEPPEPAAWGWRPATVGAGAFERDEWRAPGDRIGWLDGDDLYLDPHAAFRAADRMAGAGGERITITATTLWKRLRERGLLASIDEKRQRNTVRRTLGSSRREVVHLLASALIGERPSQSSQPSHDPHSERTGEDLRDGSWDGCADAPTKPSHENVPAKGLQKGNGPIGTVGTVSQTYDAGRETEKRETGPDDPEREVVRL